MARPKKQLTDAEAVKMRDVEAYTHDDKKRTNNPPVGMAQHDKAEEKVKTYQFDSHLDPTLQWAGKAEGMSFDVPTSSIHIHESYFGIAGVFQPASLRTGCWSWPSPDQL